MNYAIEVKSLSKHYGDVKAVDNISFCIEEGTMFGFLGVNGAGKSTTINMLCTLLKPTEGSIYIYGSEAGVKDRQIRSLIGVVRQENCLDNRLNIRENLALRGSLYGLDSGRIKSRISELTEELGLAEIIDRRYEKLSGGQKRKSEIAAALMNCPKVLFLDEPTTGLDPATRKSVWECIDSIRKRTGMTVFLTTHYMEEAATADRIAIIDSGRILESDTPSALKEKYAADMLLLEPKQGHEKAIEKYGTKLFLKNSIDALPILKELERDLAGFELVHGTMDDVFLRVTKKELNKS